LKKRSKKLLLISRCNNIAATMGAMVASFLVLFFKKEALAFLAG
jgi:hypothetical protein